MDIEQVKARLIGRKIVSIIALGWDEERRWLDEVTIELDDGTKLDSQGEPLFVDFEGKQSKMKET